MKDRYNGWTNWATWNVALWLGNSTETLDRAWRQCVRAARPADRAKALAAFARQEWPCGTPDMEGQTSWHTDVNWEEIIATTN